jgi:hypothetical protein
MIRVHVNKNDTVHATYKSKDVTLKVLMKNDVTHAGMLKTRVEGFRESECATISLPLERCVLKLDKDMDVCTVSLTKTVTIPKDDMMSIEQMLLQLCDATTRATST